MLKIKTLHHFEPPIMYTYSPGGLALLPVVVETAAAARPGLVEWAAGIFTDDEGADLETPEPLPLSSFLLAS